MDPEAIKLRFKSLSERFAHVKHFGSPANCFVLRQTLSDLEVSYFEQRFQITLPEAYREFLTKIGNGSLGPSFEVFPLGWVEGRPWYPDEVHPKGPFQHVSAWNLPTETLENLENNPEDEQQAFNLYWNPAIARGSVPISDLGCGSYLLLVVDGDQAGHIWKDCRADHLGLLPLLDETHAPLTFEMWLMDHLEKAERATLKPRATPHNQATWVDRLVLLLLALMTLALWYWIRYQE